MCNDGTKMCVINSVLNGIRYEPEITQRRNRYCDMPCKFIDVTISSAVFELENLRVFVT